MRIRLPVFLPLLLFLAFIGLGVAALFYDRGGEARVASTNRPQPHFNLPVLDSQGTLSEQTLGNTPHLVNFFASWCLPCQAEQELLSAIAEQAHVPIIGIAYHDKEQTLHKFLEKNGNPYFAIGLDPNAVAGIEWGVTGVPETFLIGVDGMIKAHIAGPLTEDLWQRDFAPQLVKAAP